MSKQRINLYVEPGVWREFRAGCVRRGKSASEMVEYLMNNQALAWHVEETLDTPPATLPQSERPPEGGADEK